MFPFIMHRLSGEGCRGAWRNGPLVGEGARRYQERRASFFGLRLSEGDLLS